MTVFGKSFINKTKHKGPKPLPCGTPLHCLMSFEKAFLTFTRIFSSRPIRNDFNQPKHMDLLCHMQRVSEPNR